MRILDICEWQIKAAATLSIQCKFIHYLRACGIVMMQTDCIYIFKIPTESLKLHLINVNNETFFNFRLPATDDK